MELHLQQQMNQETLKKKKKKDYLLDLASDKSSSLS